MAVCQQRNLVVNDWLTEVFSQQAYQLVLLAGDASFRRYFRITANQQNYVLMDAPPEHENITSYIQLTTLFRAHQLLVPEIYAAHQSQGLLLLQDFGDDLLFRVLNANNVNSYYPQAMAMLHKLQTSVSIHDDRLLTGWPQLLAKELSLFSEWYLQKNLQIDLNSQDQRIVDELCALLIHSAVEQPQVCVHRDFHSRNLLWVNNQLGMIDFQDACVGSITYDLVSLLKVCYIDWPRGQVEMWVEQFQHQAVESGYLTTANTQIFMRWFDLMGLQRHLKVLGIFSRLYLRDHKQAYLADMPRVIQYVQDVCQRYPELTLFDQLVKNKVLPCVR